MKVLRTRPQTKAKPATAETALQNLKAVEMSVFFLLPCKLFFQGIFRCLKGKEGFAT